MVKIAVLHYRLGRADLNVNILHTVTEFAAFISNTVPIFLNYHYDTMRFSISSKLLLFEKVACSM